MLYKVRYGKKIYKLGRTYKQRWHLLRTMVTQLVEHERITTTETKAKALRALAESTLAIAKKGENIVTIRRLNKILTTDFARKKILFELAPRFKDKQGNFTRIVKMGYRRGDNASLAYIEYLGNEIEKYEKAIEKQNKENQTIPDFEAWEKKTFAQEKEFFKKKIEDLEAEMVKKAIENDELITQGKLTKEEAMKQRGRDEMTKKFFERKLQQVEHDLFIVNKNKYHITLKNILVSIGSNNKSIPLLIKHSSYKAI